MRSRAPSTSQSRAGRVRADYQICRSTGTRDHHSRRDDGHSGLDTSEVGSSIPPARSASQCLPWLLRIRACGSYRTFDDRTHGVSASARCRRKVCTCSGRAFPAKLRSWAGPLESKFSTTRSFPTWSTGLAQTRLLPWVSMPLTRTGWERRKPSTTCPLRLGRSADGRGATSAPSVPCEGG